MHANPPDIPGIVADEQMARSFRQEVAHLLQRSSYGFPGAQPVSFERKHLSTLCEEDYFLCEKTDGVRCLLYCTTDESGNEIHYLIDRRNDYYFVSHLHLPHQSDPQFRKFHTDTLLDGELVWDQLSNGTQARRYLVFDCLVLDGELLTKKTFDKRIGRVQMFVEKPLKNFLSKHPEVLQSMPFEIRMKMMDKPYALDDMFSQKLPNLPHGNDGIIFTAKNTFYTFGTDEMILKWKPAHENSVDFKLQLGAFPVYDPGDGLGLAEDYDAKPVMNLCIFWESNDYRKFTELSLTDEEWEAMRSMDQQLDGRVIECYVDDSGRWRFKKEPNGTPRFRDDKPQANHVSTMHKVIKSIQDGVSEQDLREASLRIKDGWKRRHPEETRPHPSQNGR